VGPRISIFSRGSDAISPTAHYTGRVWLRNGLSDPAFATWEGQVLYAATAPLLAAAKLAGAPTLEAFLLARHHLIDEILTEGIEDGSISQIVEIAAGLSPRGLRFTREHPDITYVEADLPGMAERKRAALAAAGTPLRVADPMPSRPAARAASPSSPPAWTPTGERPSSPRGSSTTSRARRSSGSGGGSPPPSGASPPAST
jgi:hypothetical protein